MHPYLTRLGVRPEVQEFFKPYFTDDRTGNLVFSYHDAIEHFGFAFHRVPVSQNLWIAGDANFSMIKQVFVCASAMDAVAYLNLNFASFKYTDSLLFLATGAKPNAAQIKWINQNLKDKIFTLLFSKDLLGCICDLKIAAGIRRMPVAISLLSEESLLVIFRFKQYSFQANTFSLNAFEKSAKYRLNIRAQKPKNFDNYLAQLQANAFNN